MAGDGRRAGTASGYAFDLATAVRGEGERWSAEVGDGWTVAGRPNGGYLLALVARAGVEAAGQPHPLAVSGHFLSPSGPGPAELAVRRLRAGRSLSTARVTLVQEGQARLEALVTAGRMDPEAAPGWRRADGPVGLPPVEECLPARPEMPGIAMTPTLSVTVVLQVWSNRQLISGALVSVTDSGSASAGRIHSTDANRVAKTVRPIAPADLSRSPP